MKGSSRGRRTSRALYKDARKTSGTVKLARLTFMANSGSPTMSQNLSSTTSRKLNKAKRPSYGSVFHALVPGRMSVVSPLVNKKAADGPSYGSVFHALVPGRTSVRFWLLSLFVLLLSLAQLTPSTPAHAAINEQLNFQARLLNAAGGLVPDGNYNVKFRIYCGGDGNLAGAGSGSDCLHASNEQLLWSEEWLNNNTQGVRVVNGYLTVRLGSITAFASSIDWDTDELYLSIEIGDTNGTCTPFTSCTPDGQMDPFMRLTAVPYAFNSSELDGIDSTGFAQLGPAAAQSVNSATSAINLNQTGAGDLLTLQDGGTTELLFNQSGDLTLGSASDNGTLILYDGSSHTGTIQTASLGQNTVYTLPDAGGASDTFCLLTLNNCSGAQTGSGTANRVTYWTSSTNLAADDDFFFDGTQVGIGDITPDGNSKLDVTLIDTSATASDKAGLVLDVSDTGATSSNQTVIGHDVNVTHTGGGSAIFTTTGVDINVTGDGGGASTTRGLVVSVSGADNNYAATFNGGSVLLGDITATNADTILQDSGAAIFNEQGNDVDFRIEGDTEANLFFVDGGTARIGIATNAPSADLTFGQGANRTINVLTRTTSGVGYNLTVVAGAGNGSNTGGTLTLQGGASGASGNVNGGNVYLTGGAGNGTGVRGLVVLDTPTFTTASQQNCVSTPCAITQANIDSTGAVIIHANAIGYTVTLGDPTITTAGRIVYVTAANGSSDFTLSVNGGGTGNLISMRQNTTATMIWNGSDWTAAGASSSTTLQAAYDNTLTSAGGAEIVLNAPGGNADGLTIRNNGTTPISGGILEVQSSIGTNLFSVNNLGTELAANGGSETSSTWSTNWTAVGSASVSRTTTSGEYVTGQAGAEITTTAAANDGIRNNLSGNPVVSTTYQVSFTAKLDSGTFTTLQVVYSRDGGTDLETCANYSTQTLVTTGWTKVTCTITTDSTTATNPDLIIRQTDATVRTFWIDNLSFMRNDSTTEPSHVQIGGGINGGPITLFTLDRSSAPPVADGNQTYLGSMYYDTTTGRIQCYEADGWGACGAPPNNIITLTPEYAGSVLNGTGVGTMSADFCADESGVLQVNSGICATGEAVNYYAWTSPQASNQTYSIYLTFQLPTTFEEFISNSTITLDAYTTDTTDATVNYEIFRSTGSAITECGSDTTVTTSNNTWQTVAHNGNEQSGCSFADGDRVIFKLNMTARNNDTVYVSDINFTYTNE